MLEGEEEEEDEAEVEPQGFFVYRTMGNLLMEWSHNKPMSVVLVRVGCVGYEFYCCVSGYDGKRAVQLIVKEGSTAVYKFGLHYLEYELVEEDLNIGWNELSIANYGILLPMKSKQSLKHQYALITSDWRCLSGDEDLVFPQRQILDDEVEEWRK